MLGKFTVADTGKDKDMAETNIAQSVAATNDAASRNQIVKEGVKRRGDKHG